MNSFVFQCADGYAGNGLLCALDGDFDGITSRGAACNERECKIVCQPRIFAPFLIFPFGSPL